MIPSVWENQHMPVYEFPVVLQDKNGEKKKQQQENKNSNDVKLVFIFSCVQCCEV